MSVNVDIDPLDLVDPVRFAHNGYPHEVWARLRAEAPVAYIEPPGHPPFWAITKHSDIVEVATQPQLFSSAKGITLDMDLSGLDIVPEMIVYLDPPRHGPMRKVANKRFIKSAVREREDEIERIAAEVVDHAATGGEIGTCDFVDTSLRRIRWQSSRGCSVSRGPTGSCTSTGPTRSSAKTTLSIDGLARVPRRPRPEPVANCIGT